MFQGLYKAEFETPRGKAVGVVFANDGKIHGGDSAFAYIGTFHQVGHTINGTITILQHTNDPKHLSLFGIDNARVSLHGFEKNGFATFDGTAAEAPSLGLKVVLTRLRD